MRSRLPGVALVQRRRPVVRVFTNEFISQSPTWTQATTVLPFQEEGRSAARFVRAWRNARGARRRVTPADVVVLTDTHALSGSLFGLGMPRRRPTLVRTDPLIHLP